MIYLDNSWPALFTAIVTGLSLGYAMGGGKLLRVMLAPTLLMLIIVRPPFGWDRELIGSMQTLVSLMGSHVLDVFGIIHALDTNIIQLPRHNDLLVEEACSGIHSLFSAVSIAMFYALWTRRPWYHTLLLLIVTIGWVMVANVARVSAIGIAEVDYELDLATGWRHQTLGGVLFAGCLLMIWSSDQFLQFVFGAWRVLLASFRTPDPSLAEANEPVQTPTPTTPSDSSNPILLGLVVLMLGLGLVATYQIVTRENQLGVTAGPLGEPLAISNEALPKNLAGWTRIALMRITTRDQGGVYGDFSHTWAYSKDGIQAEVSLDYPFPTWKNLSDCYRNAGWTIKSQTPQTGTETGTLPHHEVTLHKNLEEHGYLLFTQLRGNDVWRIPPTGLFERLGDVLTRNSHAAGIGYQMQVFVAHPLPLSATQQAEVQALFEAACKAHRSELIRQNIIGN